MSSSAARSHVCCDASGDGLTWTGGRRGGGGRGLVTHAETTLLSGQTGRTNEMAVACESQWPRHRQVYDNNKHTKIYDAIYDTCE